MLNQQTPYSRPFWVLGKEYGDRPAVAAIIALTADISAGCREGCLDSGMDDYLPKPVTREMLVAALEKWAPQPVTQAMRA